MPPQDWLNHDEYPFVPHYYDLPAGQMHYVDEGQGRPVVMLHGNPTWSFLYRHIISGMRDEYRCIAPDYIGFGLSDKPEDFSYLPEDHARCIDQLLEHLDLHDVTLVMHDWGGPIGLDYATRHPERIRDLVIMNSWAWPVDDNSYFRFFSGFMGGPVGRYLISRHNFFTRLLMRQLSADGSRMERLIHHHYTNPFDCAEHRIGCWKFPQAVLGSSEWLGDVWQARGSITDKPMLIIWGMKDTAFRNKELRVWGSEFYNAQVMKLWDVGHYVPEETGEEIVPNIKKFLQGELVISTP